MRGLSLTHRRSVQTTGQTSASREPMSDNGAYVSAGPGLPAMSLQPARPTLARIYLNRSTGIGRGDPVDGEGELAGMSTMYSIGIWSDA